MSDFRLPDLGEGLTEATIVAWQVAVGDEVTLNQALVEVETAKALVELPSPRAGRVSALHAAEGETLAVGSPLIGFEEVSEPAAAEPVKPAAPQRQQVLVGYGPVLPGTGRPRRRPRSFETEPYVSRSAEVAAGETSAHDTPKAMPPVRRRARDLGVDLTAVHGSGPGGRILRADVEASAQGTTGAHDRTGAPTKCCSSSSSTGAGTSPHASARASGRASTRVPVTGLRRETARAMTDSAFTAPQASVHTTIDVTDTLERLRRPGRDGRKSSFLAAVCQAILPAAARTPSANARYDAEAGEIEHFSRVALGIAVATERGLVVATVPDTEEPDTEEADGATLTERIAALVATAREGSLTPAELTGSTLTVTNVGVFGVEGGVPILNPGQSTILAIGALRTQPWEHHGEIALRTVVTLTLSFDHRVLDGAEASRFLMDVADVLSDPAILLTR
ncbi:dihydrolipoamide acetyltransferase family protein [Brachybacterium sp. AOP42-C2-15]|uniref:dihydrolipoamide acetyltransferase family protein n=1 Tax=unclassified Brachybacterium TaxID=2623841 RepID=UPI003F9D848B